MIENKFLTLAVSWLNSSRDFDEGIKILTDARFRPGVTRKLAREKHRPGSSERLLVNMRSLVDAFCVSEQDLSEISADTDAELHVFDGEEDTAEPVAASGILSHENDEGNIGIVVKRYASLYRMRDQAFKQLKQVGEKNDDASCIVRKQLTEQIESCTDQMEDIYPFYEKFKASGEQPSDDDIQQLEEKSQAASKKTETDAEEPSKDLSVMDKDELVKEQYNIAKRVTRTKNKLLYQSENRLDKENPMPAGSKRLKLEKRLEKLTAELEQVKIRILELS